MAPFPVEGCWAGCCTDGPRFTVNGELAGPDGRHGVYCYYHSLGPQGHQKRRSHSGCCVGCKKTTTLVRFGGSYSHCRGCKAREVSRLVSKMPSTAERVIIIPRRASGLFTALPAWVSAFAESPER